MVGTIQLDRLLVAPWLAVVFPLLPFWFVVKRPVERVHAVCRLNYLVLILIEISGIL
jgi:hypothetical protein